MPHPCRLSCSRDRRMFHAAIPCLVARSNNYLVATTMWSLLEFCCISSRELLIALYLDFEWYFCLLYFQVTRTIIADPHDVKVVSSHFLIFCSGCLDSKQWQADRYLSFFRSIFLAVHIPVCRDIMLPIIGTLVFLITKYSHIYSDMETLDVTQSSGHLKILNAGKKTALSFSGENGNEKSNGHIIKY